MTSSEYQQLVEFLGRQFTEVDGRFAQIDRRFTEMDRQFTEQRRDPLKQEYQAITQSLRRIEAGLADERGRPSFRPGSTR